MADPAAPGPLGRFGAWLRHHIPTRESVETNRWLRPVAHRILVPSLWHLNRRSVPRGVALGLFCGILFPFAHVLIAAVLSLPTRANVPTAVGTTLVNNPITLVPIVLAARSIGHWVLRLDRAVPGRPIATNVHEHEGWLHYIAQGGAATIVGLLVLAVILSAAGYAITALAWRLRVAYRWRTRTSRRAG